MTAGCRNEGYSTFACRVPRSKYPDRVEACLASWKSISHHGRLTVRVFESFHRLQRPQASGTPEVKSGQPGLTCGRGRTCQARHDVNGHQSFWTRHDQRCPSIVCCLRRRGIPSLCGFTQRIPSLSVHQDCLPKKNRRSEELDQVKCKRLVSFAMFSPTSLLLVTRSRRP